MASCYSCSLAFWDLMLWAIRLMVRGGGGLISQMARPFNFICKLKPQKKDQEGGEEPEDIYQRFQFINKIERRVSLALYHPPSLIHS